jgi:DNA-binding winged helix-turn-helix (wHTH) protein
MIWAFGDYELDEGLYQLRRRGRAVKIEPRVFDVLLHLLRHRERVVAKDELLDALWPGEAVSDSVLPRCIAAARRALGDDRSRQHVIQTLHGRGYRFVAEVEAVDASPAEPAAPEAASAKPFVGREVALGRLVDALAVAGGGRGRVALLAGEPGIGKTRTLEELGRAAASRGTRWLAGRCHEDEGAPAFWPWVQILRAAVAVTPTADLLAELGPGVADVAELLPELRQAYPELPVAPDATGEQGRFRLFESAASFLLRVARRAPLLVSVDDLHWADTDSLRLFEFLARELRAAPLLLVGTYRDVEVRRAHPLPHLLGALARDGGCERIALRGLEPEAVAELVEAVAGASPKPALASAIADLTAGNPFFVQELAQLLAEQDRLDTPLADDSLTLPQGVRDAIGRRLEGLSSECNELLRVAAVIGREFALPILEAVAEPGGEDLLETLGEALAANVLVEVEGRLGVFSFRHALLRQTLVDELSVPRRASLHAAVGAALEAAWGDRSDAPWSELAHHFFASAPVGGADKAVHAAEQAARQAHALHAYAEATRHLEHALEALDFGAPADGVRRCELLVRLGSELWAHGSRTRARERLGEAAELARRLGRVDLLARAAVAYRGFGEMGMPPDPRTLALLEEALEAVGDDHPVLRALLLGQLSGTPSYSLSMANRERLSREALALAERSGDREAQRAALNARYWATLGPDRIQERAGVAREAHALAARTNDLELSLVAHEIDLGVHLLHGDLDAADRSIATYVRLGEELRQPVFRFLATMIRETQATNRGELREAVARTEASVVRDRGRVHYGEVLVEGQRLWIHFQRGEPEAAFPAGAPGSAAETMLLLEHFSGTGAVATVLKLLASVWVGRDDEARAGLAALAAQGFDQIERDEHFLITVGLLAWLATQLGAKEHAAPLHALLLPCADLALCHDLLRGVTGSVESLLGLLAALDGRAEEAIAHLERGVAREIAMGTRPGLVRSRSGLALLLRARGGVGDAERAGELEALVAEEARRMGIRPPVVSGAAAEPG